MPEIYIAYCKTKKCPWEGPKRETYDEASEDGEGHRKKMLPKKHFTDVRVGRAN